jgi:hypothetical protein
MPAPPRRPFTAIDDGAHAGSQRRTTHDLLRRALPLGGEALRLGTHRDDPPADVEVGELQPEHRLLAHARARLCLDDLAPAWSRQSPIL